MIRIEHPANSRGEAFGVRSGSVPLQAALLGLILRRRSDGRPRKTATSLWLRYLKVDDPVVLSAYRKKITSIVAQGKNRIAQAIQQELRRGLEGLLGKKYSNRGFTPGTGGDPCGHSRRLVQGRPLGMGKGPEETGPGGIPHPYGPGRRLSRLGDRVPGRKGRPLRSFPFTPFTSDPSGVGSPGMRG